MFFIAIYDIETDTETGILVFKDSTVLRPVKKLIFALLGLQQNI